MLLKKLSMVILAAGISASCTLDIVRGPAPLPYPDCGVAPKPPESFQDGGDHWKVPKDDLVTVMALVKHLDTCIGQYKAVIDKTRK